MNPEWLVAGVAILGMVTQVLSYAHQRGSKADILEALRRSEKDADGKYANEKVCEGRFSSVDGRLTRAGW